MSSADDRGLKRFNGEDDDPGRQLRKWRPWATAKMFTMEKLSAKQQGPFLYTLLDGKALEAVEHLEMEKLQVEDGAKLIWELLRERFPEKEAHDQMGEALGEVFGLAAKEGESAQQWSARVVEVFTKCQRKARVTFPSEAQGWIALNCAGFSEEQKAIIKAKAQGKLDMESVASSMRSCFPQYKAGCKAKRPVASFLAEPPEAEGDREDQDEFQDVEAFLADNEVLSHKEFEDAIPETEAAEALAASWKERRNEIAKFRKERKFDAASTSRKSFRVEIEELKRRTRCRKCGKIGHWARECRSAARPLPSTSAKPSSSTANAVEAQLVEQEISLAQYEEFEATFVGAVEAYTFSCHQAEVLTAGLVSSPGFGVIDSGCGRTLIGRETLNALGQKLAQVTSQRPVQYEAHSSFRYGNGATELSRVAVKIPVGIGGKSGIIDAAVIEGKAPLLLGRPTLEKLHVALDFASKRMRFLKQQDEVAMEVNRAGQLLIDIMQFPKKAVPTASTHAGPPSAEPHSHISCESESLVTQSCQAASQVPPIPEMVYSRPRKQVKKKHCRVLLSQVKGLQASRSAQIAVAELFSPPRLTEQARQSGATGLAFDIKQGCDLNDKDTQAQVDTLLDEACPQLLTASPPCTHCGGWDHLNMCYRTPLERARLLRTSRNQIRFCVTQIRKQLARGGHFLLEHPIGSRIWKDPLVQPLITKYGLHKVDMCAYGLQCRLSGLPIRKGTALLCSNPELAHGIRRCPGCPKHQVIEGQIAPGVTRSSFTGKYCSGFVQMLWKYLGPKGTKSCCLIGEPLDWEALQCECLAGEAAPVPEAPAEAGAAGEHSPDSEEIPEDRQANQVVDRALHKLHANLGHPTTRELVRILRHSGASERAIRRAALLQCSVCANQSRPTAPLPANTSQVKEFNAKLGLDIKYLPGWKVNQKVPCVNMVDYATSLQVMVPLRQAESGEVVKNALRDHWVAWAGPPATLQLDPSQPNLSEVLGHYCNDAGIDLRHTAAEAHYQLGKVERHGQWLHRVLQRVLDDMRPATEQDWQDCLCHAQTAKNSLLTEAGISPYQLVFGRNPRIPTDLLQHSPHVPASDAADLDSVQERAAAIRVSARRAMLECQDDRALRAALRARPRVQRPFRSGDWVYYWRTQEFVNGVKIDGGRWYGAALVLGSIGRNFVVAHRRSLLRCSPEQMRFATEAESTVAEFPESELLGVKTLLEKGQFPRSQFIDVTQEGRPAPADEADRQAGTVEAAAPERPAGLNAAQCLANSRQEELPAPNPEEAEMRNPGAEAHRNTPQASNDLGEPLAPSTGYAPIRRVKRKTPVDSLLRLPSARPEDFVEMMSELVPRLIEELPHGNEPSSEPSDVAEPGSQSSSVSREGSEHSVEPRTTSQKRSASNGPVEEPSSARPRLEETETLFCQETLDLGHLHRSHVECLMAAFLQKRAQKELPATGNSPDLQQQVDEAKVVEWETIQGKSAVRVWSGAKAEEIKTRYGHRFIGSRFVVTNKTDEEGTRVKARWCLQGHNDPDFRESGECHSPTLHQLSRALLLQILVSKRWVLNLGDIKGAFLEAGPIPERYRPLYAQQPPGGIPGLNPSDVIEVVGNLYGANDAPSQWYKEFDAQARKAGFQKSAFDPCLYYFRDACNNLVGVLGAHVDDTITGGQGDSYNQAISTLKKRFKYRKWRQGSGEFCGVQYSQDPHTYEISYDQQTYAKFVRPINMTKERQKQKDSQATDKEVAALRAVNGALNWLSSQTRPDMCVQASFSQQAFPNPKVSHLLYANQMLHRARQYSDVSITVRAVDWEDLSIVFHSDAGFGNAAQNKTQAGYILAFSESGLSRNLPSTWSPFCWKSYKMSRVVSSTLAGETQSYATASGIAEWMSLMVSEARKGWFDLRVCEDHLKEVPIIGVTDCKCLYDALITPTSPSKVDDKRVAIDLTIIRQSMCRTGLQVRWCPTQLMLADSLTKDQADPADLIRAVLAHGVYQLSSEAEVLAHKKEQRDRRSRRRTPETGGAAKANNITSPKDPESPKYPGISVAAARSNNITSFKDPESPKYPGISVADSMSRSNTVPNAVSLSESSETLCTRSSTPEVGRRQTVIFSDSKAKSEEAESRVSST